MYDIIAYTYKLYVINSYFGVRIPSNNYTSLKSYSALDHGRLTTKNTVNQKELDQEFALVGGDLSIE